jgi:hypothetical protein
MKTDGRRSPAQNSTFAIAMGQYFADSFVDE